MVRMHRRGRTQMRRNGLTELRCGRRCAVPISLVGLLAAAVGGCTAAAPMAVWQAGAERSVLADGRLDQDKIRLLSEAGLPTRARPELIVVGEYGVDLGSTLFHPVQRDALGVLVDVVSHESREWLIFLVGFVRRDTTWRYNADAVPVIENIQPVALTAGGGKARWAVGSANPEALRRYYANAARSMSQSPAHAAQGFPGPADEFRIVETEDELRVCEARTRACWALHLPHLPERRTPITRNGRPAAPR